MMMCFIFTIFFIRYFLCSVLVPPRGLGVSILGGAIVAIVRIRTYLIRTT